MFNGAQNLEFNPQNSDLMFNKQGQIYALEKTGHI